MRAQVRRASHVVHDSRNLLILDTGNTRSAMRSRMAAPSQNALKDSAARMTGSDTRTVNIISSNCGSVANRARLTRKSFVVGHVTGENSSRPTCQETMKLAIQLWSTSNWIPAGSAAIVRVGSGAVFARLSSKFERVDSRLGWNASITSMTTSRVVTLPK